jgi:hypothetical protein
LDNAAAAVPSVGNGSIFSLSHELIHPQCRISEVSANGSGSGIKSRHASGKFDVVEELRWRSSFMTVLQCNLVAFNDYYQSILPS